MIFVCGAIWVLGVLALPADIVSATINDRIELQGEEFQIAISPAYVEFDLVPGATTGESFRVRNVGSQETDLKIGIRPLQFYGETTMLGTPRNEIVDWSEIIIEPGCEATRTDAGTGDVFLHMRVKEECNVRFATETPVAAPFGEQYMNVFFEEYRENVGGGMQTIRSIGANVYGTNRAGDEGAWDNACAKVSEQSVPFWLFEGPLDTSALIENCGRLNFHASISVEVRNLFGALVYEETQAQDRIIPAQSKRMVSDVGGDIGIGVYKTKQTVGALGETYVVEKWTVLIPVWLLVIILLCVMVAIFSFIYDYKKKRMRFLRKK